MTSYFPATYPVVHIARRFSGTDPDTGNPTLHTDPPVVRYAQELVQTASSDEMDGSGQFVDRVASTLQMAVDDCTLYTTDDQVIVSPTIAADGSWVADTGEAYWVDGIPNDQRGGPWSSYFQIFGGIVILKKVT